MSMPSNHGCADNGHIDVDNNVFERSIWPIALNRKDALFAGSDSSAAHSQLSRR